MRWAPAGQRPASGRVVAASGRTRHDRWASPNRGAWRVKRCPEGGLIVAARHSVSSTKASVSRPTSGNMWG